MKVLIDTDEIVEKLTRVVTQSEDIPRELKSIVIESSVTTFNGLGRRSPSALSSSIEQDVADMIVQRVSDNMEMLK
ncbi:hypothetical protein MUDAN_BIHEEGNE_03203 [Lactiplantibacillus mudanjiangensis]|uniref:hypothetical protein n=1 Tax=Lactiplantibacillus mudanjiangensis TaxID=1296538 RepID=UPI001014222F|nr:hypothetical protein MUDAN_BIHEEGNE_03203 [Lactiplantibacillus mudanjiangensis]